MMEKMIKEDLFKLIKLNFVKMYLMKKRKEYQIKFALLEILVKNVIINLNTCII
jgi:hypothetical protein